MKQLDLSTFEWVDEPLPLAPDLKVLRDPLPVTCPLVAYDHLRGVIHVPRGDGSTIELDPVRLRHRADLSRESIFDPEICYPGGRRTFSEHLDDAFREAVARHFGLKFNFGLNVFRGLKRGELLNWPKLEERTVTPLEVRPITDFATPPDDDENELLQHRFLCRGGAMMLVGQSGIGKSSLTMQLAFLWGIGRPAFGIAPVTALTSLIIQAENDDGDLAEMRVGVSRGLGFTAANMNEVRENVLVALCDSSTGLDFLNRVVAPLLERHRPDILWIDPLLAYLGGDAVDQEAVSEFLRNGLNPLLRKYDCAAVIIHHTGKPRQDTGGKREMSNADFSYAGLGSSELTNWPRAVLVLQQEGQLFKLHAAKRGARLHWENPGGERVFVKHIAHATETGVICWRECEAEESARASATGRGQKSKEDLMRLVPVEGQILKNSLIVRAQEAGIGRDKARSFIDELIDQGTLFPMRVAREGTNAAISLSRHSQEPTTPQAELPPA